MKDRRLSCLADRSGGDSLDDVTLARLTWLWLAYGGFALAAGQTRLPPACPFRLITGHRCPLCGLTRSVSFFLRGRLEPSFREHWAGPGLFAGSGFLLALAWSRRSPGHRYDHGRARSCEHPGHGQELTPTGAACLAGRHGGSCPMAMLC